MIFHDRPRESALRILRNVELGEFATPQIDRSRTDFKFIDRAFLLELVYGVLRNRSYLDYCLNLFSEKSIDKTDGWTRNILRLGAYQLLFLDKVPSSAAVNTSVELAKRKGRKPCYVNALLRSLERSRGTIGPPSEKDTARRLSILYSHPEWLVRRWLARYGMDATENLLRSNNVPAPLTIRTNTLKTTREGLKASLEAEGAVVKETVYSPVGLEIISCRGITSLSAYKNGWFVVQDEAAQIISLILDPKMGESVLDACAAPGGKTTHIAELMKNTGRIIALDADVNKTEKIKENSIRLGLSIITPVIGDAAAYNTGEFDRILVDAPCSGLGVLRRHPDGRWIKKEESIALHRRLQTMILDNCAGLLRPGGVLVYSTCTTEPEENEDVIKAFLERMSGVFCLEDPSRYLPAPAAELVDSSGFFRTFPTVTSMDGFFAARLVKNGGLQI